MTAKNRVLLRIAGMEYMVRGTESEEYMHKLGLFVDKKMGEIIKSNNKLSTCMAAVLTALNIADDYTKTYEKSEKLENELKKLREELSVLKAENENLAKEYSNVNGLYKQLQLDFVKSDTELKEVRKSMEKLEGQNNKRLILTEE
ncbi:MAG TPA: cell division protein ZapA [Clostridiales bacterium]|nr:cell division protein ZapA [Clostridiales bacterium]